VVRRSKGIRSKSRNILKKKPRDRGIVSITRALHQFEEGKQGDAYLVGINDGKKHKTLIVRSEHLRRVQ
jgi:ribosomal protein L21E